VQRGRVTLGRAYDPASADGPERCLRLAPSQLAHGRALVELGARALDGRGESAQKLRRMHARDVRRERGQSRAGHAHTSVELVAFEDAQIGLVEAECALLADVRAQ